MQHVCVYYSICRSPNCSAVAYDERLYRYLSAVNSSWHVKAYDSYQSAAAPLTVKSNGLECNHILSCLHAKDIISGFSMSILAITMKPDEAVACVHKLSWLQSYLTQLRPALMSNNIQVQIRPAYICEQRLHQGHRAAL